MNEARRRDRCEAILGAYLAGAIRAEIALMRLILATGSAAELARRLAAARHGPEGSAQRLDDLVALAGRHPGAWRIVRAAADAVPPTAPGAGVEAAVADLAAGFDAAARLSPEASVALYSLGDANLLAAATGELVAWLLRAGLLGADRRLLDLGCGAGRLEAALHAEVGSIVGLDISAELLAVGRARCRAFGNVAFRRGSGLDLDGLPVAGFDAVVAVDSFPYLVDAGGDLAARHFTEAARVLRPAGELVVFNFSYRGEPARDRNEVGRFGAAAGFRVVEADSRPFALWDGAVFRLVRR